MPHEDRPSPGQGPLDPRARRGRPEEINDSVTPLVRAPERGRESLPDWAPWAVLGALLALGVVGAVGLLPLGRLDAQSGPNASAARGSVRALASTSAPTPSASAAPYEYITASHIVVSYRGTLFASRYQITRNHEEAKALADNLLARAQRGEDFEKLVSEYSDDPQTKAQQGRVGRFTRRDALPAFSEVAFALAPGAFGIAHTAFGYHVIARDP